MRIARLAVPLAVVAASSAGCTGPGAHPLFDAPADRKLARYLPGEAPAALAPAVVRADAAIRTFRDRLAATLAAELSRGGPASALHLCRTTAPALAAEVSAQTGVEVGRTSARLRGASSAPRRWAAPVVEETAGRRAAEVQPVVVDLGERVGVLRPIAVASSCLACHGGAERIAPEVEAALETAYPSGRGRGFAEGDLAGYFWAEANR